MKIYDSTMTVLRGDYRSDGGYREALRNARNHYGYQVRVEGGWKFFEFESDMKVWKAQK